MSVKLHNFKHFYSPVLCVTTPNQVITMTLKAIGADLLQAVTVRTRRRAATRWPSLKPNHQRCQQTDIKWVPAKPAPRHSHQRCHHGASLCLSDLLSACVSAQRGNVYLITSSINMQLGRSVLAVIAAAAPIAHITIQLVLLQLVVRARADSSH